MQPCYLNFCIKLLQIWSVSSNELFTSQVRLYSEQIYRYWKLIDMKLEMCDANVQKHQFKISQYINIVLKS